MDKPPSSPIPPFKSLTYAGPATGPRLIVTGAVHGNETCGTIAIGRVMDDLDSGRLQITRGEVTFVPVTNPLAYAKGERAGDRNLNRNLRPTVSPADFESHVANWICPLLARHEVLLDLHSTRAASQPFAMVGPRNNTGELEPFARATEERYLARVLGVSRFVEGWLDTYAIGVRRRVAGGKGSALNADPIYGVGTTEYMRSVGGYAITLECGQHADAQSPEVGYRAIRRALAHLGLTDESKPEPVAQYEALSLHEVIDRNDAEDKFARQWASFDPVTPGDAIGIRKDGSVVSAQRAGRILFPDAGALPGNEWFYLAQSVTGI